MDNFAFSNTGSGNPALYIAPTDNGWCAYLLASGTTNTNKSLSLTDTVPLMGYYLFAANAPTIDGTTLAGNVWNFLSLNASQPPFRTNAIIWLFDPNTVLSSSNTLTIGLNYQGNNTFSVLDQLNYNFGNNFASFFISNASVTITIDETNNRFQFIPPNQAPASVFFLRTNQISSNAQVQSSVELPFTGQGRGCLRFMIGFNHATDLVAFDTASKYFYTDQSTQNIVELSYPQFVIGSRNELLLLQGSIYPFDLLNNFKTGTYLAFTGQTLNTTTNTTTATSLASNFNTDYGYPLSLVPVVDFTTINGSANFPAADSALLVFSERAPNDPTDSWYMVPGGCYTIAVDPAFIKNLDANKQMRLVGGLAGTESISFTPSVNGATGDRLHFYPGNNAYAIQFPIAQTNSSSGGGTNTQQWLNGSYLTAWAGVDLGATANAPVVYHSQPQGSSLFATGMDVFGSDKQLLGYFIANSGTLSAAQAPVNFPLVSYSSNIVAPAGADIMGFETQIINPSRKATITSDLQHPQLSAAKQQRSMSRLAAAPDVTPSTSPQGFYIEVDNTTHIWDLMQLASNQFIQSDGKQSPVFTLSFSNLSATLQSTFQSNQLFLVISYNSTQPDGTTVLGKYSSQQPNGTIVPGEFNNIMSIEGWPFNLDVPTQNVFQQYSNIIIFKFCSGKLSDRIQNTQLWTNPTPFNDTVDSTLDTVSTWLNNYVQGGINKFLVNKDPDYQNFYNIVTSDTWQGVLALGVDIGLDEFPADLQGLLAGIDLSRFNAHHFGINMSMVQNTNGQLNMQATSSLFGLIDYEDVVYESLDASVTRYQQEAPLNTTDDYTFTVLTLKVLFSNSRIINFNSYIALTINKLFGETVKNDNRNNLLILKGTYENHNGVPSYTFNNTSDNLLYVKSAIIQDLEIVKTSFNTIVSQDNDTDLVSSRFTFWGFINFNQLDGFDLLSFGNEKGEAPNGRGILYSNLYLNLSFPRETPTTRTFTFDISQIAFDIGQSTARADSLYRHFPLQLTGMTTGDSKNTPTSQGYLNVLLPSLKQQQGISGTWYGLLFNLNMGTLGALASAAGFNSTFMAGWSVGAVGAAGAVRLPGVNPQAPFFSLQGILRLNIGAVSLSLADDSGPGNMQYLMKINNISLKLLSLSFPPNGNVGFFLFGNPASDAPPESLGWYGAYVEKAKTKQGADTQLLEAPVEPEPDSGGAVKPAADY
jgi:hypothetical protein